MPEQARGQATKQRFLDASSELFRRQGYNGTGVKQIVTEASAPFGSLYHFFPGGKEELCAEVITWSGGVYAQLIDLVIDPAPDLATGIRDFFRGAADTLETTGYEDACPIATIALEVASTSEPLRLATNEVFESWITALIARGVAAGLSKQQARSLSLFALSTLEGAFILARAARSPEPLLRSGEFVAQAFEAARPKRRRKR